MKRLEWSDVSCWGIGAGCCWAEALGVELLRGEVLLLTRCGNQNILVFGQGFGQCCLGWSQNQ